MTALSWYAHLIDINTDTVVATSTDIEAPAFGSTIDAVGKVHAEFRPGQAFCDACITAWGGPSYNGPVQAYLFEMSQDGGIKFDCSMWVETGQVNYSGPNVGVVLDGLDIASGFDRSYIDDATYIDNYIEDVLGEGPGKIRVNSSHLMLSGRYLPIWWRGLLDHTPCRGNMAGAHRFKFKSITNSRLAGNRVDTDVNTDSILRTLSNVIASASGVFDPAHPELFGADQHFSFDTMHRLVYSGWRGNTPVLNLRSDISTSQANEAIEAAIVDSDTNYMKPDLSTFFAQAEFKGGPSTHNLPSGGSFTSGVMINKPSEPSSIGEYDNLLLAGISTGNGGGGVYTWIGDGALRRLSQSLDVTGLTLDGTQNKLYACTPHGIYTRDTVAPYDQADWSRIGGTDIAAQYEYTKVWIPQPGVIYAIASGSNNGTGVNGVWRYDLGTPGWIRAIGTGNIVDASGSDSELYYCISNSPSKIVYTHFPSNGSKSIVTGMNTGAHIVGMDFDGFSGEVIVRTELGANAIYRVKAGAASSVDPTHSLADNFGPLAVAEFLAYTGIVNRQVVNGICITDRGLYWRPTALGRFNPSDGQSGIQNVNGISVAIGQAQTIMGRIFIPIAVIASNSIYLSRDGGLHFRNEMTQSLDALPAWYEAIKQFTGRYPTGDVAAFGSYIGSGQTGTPSYNGGELVTVDLDPSDPEGTGTIIPVPEGDPLTLPINIVAARRWTANNTFSWRLVDLLSNAPYNATRPAELIEVYADDSRSVLDGSSAIMTAAYRFLAQARRPMFSQNLTISYSTQAAAARFVINGDMVKVNNYVAYSHAGHISVLCDMVDQPMIIIDKQGQKSPTGEWLVNLVLVNDAAFSLLDLQKIIAGVANGQAKDRRKAGVRIR